MRGAAAAGRPHKPVCMGSTPIPATKRFRTETIMSVKTNCIYNENCVQTMARMPADSVQCVITSPPYWGLRDYHIPASVWGGEPHCKHAWGTEQIYHRGGPHGNRVMLQGGRSVVEAQAEVKTIHAGRFCQECGAWQGCLGLEPTPEQYVDHVVKIFRQVRRVLNDHGTLWLNLGDSYASGMRTKYADDRHKYKTARAIDMRPPTPDGLKSKDLIGIPWRVAFALQADGWYLRSDIIWSKPNPMPESVRDRPTKAHEYLFLMSKSERYYYDADAIAEPVKEPLRRRADRIGGMSWESRQQHSECGIYARNMRAPSGWDTSTGEGGHGKFHKNGRENNSVKKYDGTGYGSDGSKVRNHKGNAMNKPDGKRNRRSVWEISTQPFPEAHFATFPEKLVEPCLLAGSREGDVVYDPFMGSGTVALVALRGRRIFVGSEISAEYCAIAQKRIEPLQQQLNMF